MPNKTPKTSPYSAKNVGVLNGKRHTKNVNSPGKMNFELSKFHAAKGMKGMKAVEKMIGK